MNSSRMYLLFLLCLASLFVGFVSLSKRKTDPRTQHYAFFGRDRARIYEPGFLHRPQLEGAQLTYAWRELEPTEDAYDFSEIEKDLSYLQARGKTLFVQLQDATFVPTALAVPDYLTREAIYNGGVVGQYDQQGALEGQVAMRWHPAVRQRFHKLLAALGQAFDGRIAGINLQETSVGITEGDTRPNGGFTYTGYRDALLANMSALKQAFPMSVAMMYLNYLPGEWLPGHDLSYMRSLFEHARHIGLAIGAPDLMPNNLNQNNHAYRFMRKHKEKLVLGIAVQDGNYSGVTGVAEAGSATRANTVPELFAFARFELGVRYLFWGGQEPYFSRDVLAFLRGL